MKKLLMIVGLAFAASVIHAADPAPVKVADSDPYAAGQFSVSPFAAVNAKKADPTDGQRIAGLQVGYAITRNISVTAEAAGRDTDERFIDQWGAHGKGILPFGNSGLALYGEVGYQRLTQERLNYLSTGAGLEVRGRRVGAFGGARWLQNFAEVGHLQYILGVSFRF